MSTDLEQTIPPEAPPELAALLDDFVKLEKKRRELEDQLEDCTNQINRINEPLVELFALNGVQNCRKDGLTIYLKRDRYVSRRKEVTNETLCDVLKNLGMGYMVSEGYSASSLKSRVREYEDEGKEIPPNLAALLNVGEVVKLATRRS